LWHLDLNGDGRIQGTDAAFFLRLYEAKRLQIQSGGR
jgi:hypothetical protein